METVCHGKQWDVLLAADGDGAIPFLYGKKFGLKYIVQPQLTPWSGPWLRSGMDEARRQATLEALAAGLRGQKALLCMQRFSPEMSDAEPFVQYGFRLTIRHTYRFDPLPEPSQLVALADRGRRRGVEEVRRAYSIDRTVQPGEFADLHIKYWERRSGRDLLGRDIMQHVCTVALERGQALLYGLRDGDGTLMAARFVVFDSHCAYALMSAMQPHALRNSMSLLVWELLADLYGRTGAFDFEGGMEPGVGHFYSSFGTTQTPYLCIYRSSIPFLDKYILR